MQRPQLITSKRRPRNRRRVVRAPDTIPTREATEPIPTREAAERRDARRGGGPQDQAFYTCACGYAFTATVSTSVACPHCGSDQAW